MVFFSWGPKNFDLLRSWIPEGNAALQRAWLDDYLRAVQWVRESGVAVSGRFEGVMTIGNPKYQYKRRETECKLTRLRNRLPNRHPPLS